MPEALPASETRTPEQHAAVRRRSWIFSVCGMLCGLAGIVMLLARAVDVAHPPAVLAVNLSFCAMMMGIGIIFYAHGTPGNARSIVACIAAMIAGFAGPLIYAKQSLNWHLQVEHRELSNAATIASAAQDYARSHHGNYPAGLIALLEARTLTLENLRSPFGTMQFPVDARRMQVELQSLLAFDDAQRATGEDLSTYRQPLYNRLAQEVDNLSDYQYFAADLRLPPADPKSLGRFGTLPEEIIIDSSRNAIMSKEITVAFADGHSVFLDLGGAESALLKSNDAREALGFPAIRPPEAVSRGQDVERRNPPPK